MGVKILSNENEILNNSDLIVQLNILSDEKISSLKENQSLIGVFDPYRNKEKLDNLIKKKNNCFLGFILPRINRSSIHGYFVFTSQPCWL